MRTTSQPIYAAPPRIIENPFSIDNPVLEFFRNYWTEKRGARAMPSRAAINTREIKQHLGWVSLLDALPGFTDFRYRLVGSRITDFFLGDGTGKTISEAFEGPDRALGDAALWVYRKACLDRQPLRITAPGGDWRGRYYPDNDTLYLPLSTDGETADKVMSVFTFNYEEYRQTLSIQSLQRSA
jgi:hypothetical protein